MRTIIKLKKGEDKGKIRIVEKKGVKLQGGNGK